MPKKPYKLKFDKKVDLFCNGSAKTWVLLANYCDKSLIRNHIAYNLGAAIGLDTTTTSQFIDLYINGVYQGVYEICEQTEVNDNRVEISKSLESTDTGYLLELDGRVVDEGGVEGVNCFYLDGTYYGVKSPEMESVDNPIDFINYIKGYLSICYDSIIDKNWIEICNLIDIDSFAKGYIIHEIMKSGDVGWTSFYLYKQENGKLFCGPLWDFDTSSGNYSGVPGVNNPNNLYAREKNIWFNSLLEVDEFKALVKQLLIDNIDNLKETVNNVTNIYKLGENSFNRNFEKWDILNTHVWPTTEEEYAIHTWEGQVGYVKKWILDSINYVYEYYVTNE